MTWAFARDGGLPLSWFFRKINPITGMPVNAVALSVALAICLCLPLVRLLLRLVRCIVCNIAAKTHIICPQMR